LVNVRDAAVVVELNATDRKQRIVSAASNHDLQMLGVTDQLNPHLSLAAGKYQ
jgi:hypothetical protein